MSQHTVEPLLFENIFSKPVVLNFDAEHRTSDAGLSLLAALDQRLSLTKSLMSCFVDRRDKSRTQHSLGEFFQQRVFSIASGAADACDAARLGKDPALLLACGRRADDPRGLASQPTLSRFESSVGGRELVDLERKLEDFVIAQLQRNHPHARRIFIDLDATVDPTHGQQPFAYFNGHYDTWCYLPMMGFLTVDGEAEQFLFHARLRAGTCKEIKGTPALLRRVVRKLRQTCPKAKICVRLDAGFAYPQLLDLLDELGVEYMVAIGENPVLARISERHMAAAEFMTREFGLTTTFYCDGQYAARSWKAERRVICKAEVVQAEGKSDRRNARYVVTNLRQSAELIWRIYCKRGDSENRIKELKVDLEIDRTSCTRFLANQLRVLMTATAFVLFQELRRSLAGTELHRSMVATLRLRLIKIGATIKESVRRIVISMPSSHPWKDLWRLAAARIAALA